MYIRLEGRELEEWGCKTDLIIYTIKKIIRETGISNWYMDEMRASQPSKKAIVNTD